MENGVKLTWRLLKESETITFGLEVDNSTVLEA